MKIRELDSMPFDKAFEMPNGGEELCHATGIEVNFDGDPKDLWWNEYEDSEGNLRYGR